MLQLALGAAAVLAIVGGSRVWLEPGLDRGRLTMSSRTVFEAVGRAVLDGSLPAPAALRDAAVAAHLQRLDGLLAALPAWTQAELSRLLALLMTAPGRLFIAGLGPDWPDASLDAVQQALSRMRTSRLALRQQVYHALRDLTNAAYYADPQAWSRIGYPGPRDL